MYLICGTCKTDAFFGTNLTTYITVYIIVSYLKRYKNVQFMNRKSCLKKLMITTFFLIVLIIATDLLGLKISFLTYRTLTWVRNGNPLIIACAFYCFVICNNTQYRSPKINKISSLVLYIYLIHENVIVRNIIRPVIWEQICILSPAVKETINVLLFSFIIMLVSLATAAVYAFTLRKLSYLAVDKMYDGAKKKVIEYFEN